jgi:hypothetical protein
MPAVFLRVYLRLRAAFLADRRKPDEPFVRTARRAAAFRAPAPRFRAALRACRDRFAGEAAECPSRFNALDSARERLSDRARFPCRPFSLSRCACLRVRCDVLRPLGCDNSTPARLAFESPIAIACFVLAAPCFPSRMWCISSRTNSPAWVLGDLPSSLSRFAPSITSCSGMTCSINLNRVY